MNKLKKNKLMTASIISIILGIVCLFLEGTLYGGVDDNGVLQESFFLPLGMLSLLLGIFIAFFLIFRRLLFLLFAKKMTESEE